MRIVVTGRAGQLASSLAERALRRADVEILRLGRPELDLERPETIAPAILAAAPDLVINAAAYTAVDPAEDEPERAHLINAIAAGEVAAAARMAGAPVVQISTDYVFDGSSPVAYTEHAATGPLSVYGRSKLEGEERVRAANPDYLVVRTAWVYSPFGRNFVQTMIENATKKIQSISVVADQIGNPTSALDFADALLRMAALRQKVAGHRTYHLAGSGEASWADLAEGVFDVCESFEGPSPTVLRIGTAEWPTKARRPPRSTLDCARFEADFGYRMPDWRTSLPKVVERIMQAMR